MVMDGKELRFRVFLKVFGIQKGMRVRLKKGLYIINLEKSLKWKELAEGIVTVKYNGYYRILFNDSDMWEARTLVFEEKDFEVLFTE